MRYRYILIRMAGMKKVNSIKYCAWSNWNFYALLVVISSYKLEVILGETVAVVANVKANTAQVTQHAHSYSILPSLCRCQLCILELGKWPQSGRVDTLGPLSDGP